MRRRLRSIPVSLLLAAVIGLMCPSAHAHAQPSAGQSASSPAPDLAEATVKPGAEVENNEFRHAPMVKVVGRMIHMKTEAAAQLFEDVNSGILLLAILYLILKLLPKALRNRTATLQKQLIEARSATELANERLTAVEAKLARLSGDIDAMRQQVERDILEDEERIKRSIEDEKDKIIKSAEQEIESASAAARRELKRFAVELSVERAAGRVRLTEDADRALIERFGKDLMGQFDHGGRN